MIKLPLIHFNYKFFEGDRPCFANKQFGVFCDNCSYYEKINNPESFFTDIPRGRKISGSNELIKILIIKLNAVGDVLRTTSMNKL